MKRFIVIADEESMETTVKKHFPDYYPVVPGVWLIAADKRTASFEIRKQLTSEPDNSNIQCLVAVLETYNGLWNAELWEKLHIWEEL